MNPLLEPSVALAYAPADQAAAEALAEFLRAGMRISVSMESTGDGVLADAFERGLSCDAIVTLVSANEPRRGGAAQWERLAAEASDLGASLAVYLLSDCPIPAVLKQCARPRDMRAVKRWLMRTDWTAPTADAGLDDLLQALADRPGIQELPAGSDRIAAFVRAARHDFEAVAHLDCAGRSAENLATELCLALEAAASGTHGENLERVADLLSRRRVLLALDRLEDPDLIYPLVGPLCSLLFAPPAERAFMAPPQVADLLRNQDTAALQWAETAYQLAAPSAWELAREIGILSLRLAAKQKRNAEALRWAEFLSEEASQRFDRELAIEAAREKAWLLDSWNEISDFPSIPEVPAEQMSLFG